MEEKKSMQVVKAAPEKVASTVATFFNEFIFGSSENVFIRGTGKSYQQIVSEFVKVSDIQMAPEKVTSTVGTFLNEFNFGSLFGSGIGYSYRQVVSDFLKVSTIQAASEKVASTVATFLNEDTDDLRFIRVNFHLKRFI